MKRESIEYIIETLKEKRLNIKHTPFGGCTSFQLKNHKENKEIMLENIDSVIEELLEDVNK